MEHYCNAVGSTVASQQKGSGSDFQQIFGLGFDALLCIYVFNHKVPQSKAMQGVS